MSTKRIKARMWPYMLISALYVLVISGSVSADTVNYWYQSGVSTWTNTSGGTGDGLRTVNLGFSVGSPAYGSWTLNQVGGTIELKCDGVIGQQGTSGTYNMSGNARLVATNILSGGAGTMTMTDNASAALSGYLDFSSAGTLLIGGAATFSVTSLRGFNNASEYISFVSGSIATLTITGTHNYTNLVNNGYIRIDGLVTNISGFSESGNTLSLMFPPTGLTAKNAGRGILLSWISSSTAAGYKVYRSSTNNGSGYIQVGGVSGQDSTNYIDVYAKYLTDYYYVVSATNNIGESPKTTPPCFIMIPPPGTLISIF